MSTAEQANDWIAERVLDFHPTGEEVVRKAIVRLARPVYHPAEGEKHGHWTASFEIDIDNGRTIARRSYGEDGIQALQLAMSEIGAILKYVDTGGEFRLSGDPDLGFPIAGEKEP